MWPWEHVVFGYLLYSMYTHLRHGTAPSGRSTVVMAVAAVVPDLIDKPLAWEFDVFATGYALAHSVFFVVPLLVVVHAVVRNTAYAELDGAFAVGYVSHLLGDLLPASIRSGELAVNRLLWPFRSAAPDSHGSLSGGVRHYLTDYLSAILSLDPTPYVVTQAAMLLVAVVVWIADGTPPLPDAVEAVRTRGRRQFGD